MTASAPVTVGEPSSEAPKGWRWVPLSEVAELTTGHTPDRKRPDYWNGGIPWINLTEIRDLDGRTAMDTELQVSDEGIRHSSAVVHPAGTVCFSRTASIGFVTIMGRPMATSQDFVNWICGEEIDPAYLMRALLASRQRLRALSSGSTHKTIYVRVAEQFQIALPPIEEQRRIAAVLDKADELRAKRRASLALLDTLTESIFFDMFGDPATNRQGWGKVPLSDLSDGPDGIKCGPFGTQLAKDEFLEGGVPLWGIRQVNRDFELPTREFVSEEKAGRLRSFSLVPGDVVMTRKGNVGTCALYPSGFPDGIMHSDLLRLRVNGQAEPAFLVTQLRVSREVDRQVAMVSSGAIMAGINVTKLKAITVLVPPLNLQRAFVRANELVSRQRRAVVRGVDDSEDLFASLQQRAFRGEL